MSVPFFVALSFSRIGTEVILNTQSQLEKTLPCLIFWNNWLKLVILLKMHFKIVNHHFSKRSVFGKQTTFICICILYTAAFMLWWQRWMGATKTLFLTNATIYTIWPFTENHLPFSDLNHLFLSKVLLCWPNWFFFFDRNLSSDEANDLRQIKVEKKMNN